jgi:invasion protein IalB
LSFVRAISIGFAGVLLFTAAAFGQVKTPTPTPPHPAQPPAPPAPVSSEPQTTTASYGAWTLRCQHRQDGGADTRICEVDQGIVPQGQQTPVAQIGLGRPTPKDDMHVTAIVPNNVTFPSVPKISNGDKDPGVDLTWRRCVPIGCLADAILKDDVQRAWRVETAENTGHLVFIDAAGRTLNVQFSFRGFAQAMDALAKEK